METLFSGCAMATTVFYSADLELAYVTLEDEGDYWSILASLGDDMFEDGAMQQFIDKDIRHPNPEEYVKEQYKSVVNLVRQLLKWKGEDGIQEEIRLA